MNYKKLSVIWLMSLTFFSLRLCLGNAKERFCALRVHVLSKDLKPLDHASVELIDSSGKVIQTEDTVNGYAEFCDFGFGFHSLRVRTDPQRETCQTIVSNLKYLLYFPQDISVILNACPWYGGDGGGKGTTCTAFIRVTGPSGIKISGAQVRTNQNSSLSILTDHYGTARVPIDIMSSAGITISKDGYRGQTIIVECSHVLSVEELTIELKPLD